MNELNLHLENVADKDELHALLKSDLALPDYYGGNLDALWDLLGGWIETPVRIHIWGVSHLRDKIGDYADRLIDLFKQASMEFNGVEIVVH